MADNSNRSSKSKQRSFKLTKAFLTPDASVPIGTFRDAIKFTLIQQLPLLLLTSIIMDGGMIFKRVMIASIAFWFFVVIIKIRRGPKIPDIDILIIKWGYIPIVLVTNIIWIMKSVIMS